MSLITEKEILLLFGGLLLAGILEFPCILVMHFLMPKAVLARYWKMPHFRPMELGLFTDTFYAPMRTVMLMWVIAYPRFGKRRSLTEAHTLAPRWYRIAAKVFCIWALVLFAGFYVAMTALTIYFWFFTDTNAWPETMALVISLACFGGGAVYQRHVQRREADSAAQTKVCR